MSGGAIAAIVIMVLLAFVAAIGVFVLWKTRPNEVRKFFRLKEMEMTETSRSGANPSGNPGL